MRRICTLGLAPLFVLAAACGDDGGSTGTDGGIDAPMLENPGFPVPTAITKANMKSMGVWTEIGDADWTCLNTPSDDQPSTQSISLTGTIEDFQGGPNVGNATVTAFPGIMLTANSATATSSNVAATRGEFAMSLPMLSAGETRYGFKVEAASYVKTYLLNQYLNPANPTLNLNISAVAESTANALPAFVGVTRDNSKGVLAGALRDCQGREVSNAVATVSSTAGAVAHLPGAITFYFSAASSSLPVRHSQSPTMNKDGLFVVLELPPQTAPAFIQIWGFRTEAELAAGTLTLLSELPSPVEGNAVITGSFEPKRM
ncbi:MAG: hypothetical protein IPL61_06270 [Myxococcales bacterium]|nr:hypothetical protein [Myxococcales bacterium]